jgi:hypothetical protein
MPELRRVLLVSLLALCAVYWVLGASLTAYPFLPKVWQAGMARILATPEASLPLGGMLSGLLGLLFIAVASAMFLATSGSMLHSDWLVRLTTRIRDLESRRPIPASPPADAERLRSDLAEMEARLRSEWRFVVALIVAVLLGTVGVIGALLRALK